MYKQIVTCDVKSGLVSIPVLRLSRDQEQATVNVVEREDPLDSVALDDNKQEIAEKKL